MKATALLSLLFTTVSLALPHAEYDSRPCQFAPQVIYTTLPDGFSLRLGAPSAPPKVDKSKLGFLPTEGGDWDYGVHAAGKQFELTLKDGTLANAKNAVAVTLEPRGRPRWLRIGFKEDPSTGGKTAFEAVPKCIDGKSEMVVRPTEGRGRFSSSMMMDEQPGLIVK